MPNLSVEKEADDVVLNVVNQLKQDIEAKLNMKLNIFKPVRYRTQTVRGTNFYVKLKIAGVSADSADAASSLPPSNNQPIKFIHVRIWRDLPVHDFKLTLYDRIEFDKLESDPIDYFE